MCVSVFFLSSETAGPPVFSEVAVTKIVYVTHGSSSETLLNW